MTNLIGHQLDNYRIDALLGEGGMGSVYRAYDVNLARPVAVKVMHRQFANKEVFRQRFLQEAQAAARLSDHASIVNIYDFGLEANNLFMVMEFVPGASLGAFIKRLHEQEQVIKLSETLLILAQVADALGYAHRRGVVHRDVKPDNVLLRPLDEPDRPGELPIRAVVTDFGLAKLIEGGVQTQTGTFLGTLPYMSPEQSMGRDLDGRSDIYSLGVILYQLATGQLPFDIKSPTDAVMKHMNEIPPDPTDIRPGLPVSIENIIKKAIAKAPGDRFQRGEEMAGALRKAAAGLTDEDVTRFAAHDAVVSLATQLVPMAFAIEPSRLGFEMTALPGQDRLLIARAGENPRSISLEKDSYTIGRSAGNDITLTGEGISRKHLRLEKRGGGWQVVDLGSTNGTFLEDKQLTPQVPQLWTAGQALKIGPYLINLQQIEAAAPLAAPRAETHLEASQPARPPRREPTEARRPVYQYSMDMRPLRLESGGICRVLIKNEGNTAMTYQISGHDPAGVINFETVGSPAVPASLTIGPGQRDTIDLQLNVKDRPLIGSLKTVPFEVQVRSQMGQQQMMSGQLDIQPVLPRWVIPLVAVLALILCLTGGGLLTFFNNQSARATETAEAATAIFVAAAQTEEALAGIAAQETAAALEATGAAATATAEEAARLGDDDDDGLSNSQESELSTDPENPDTDGDGLTDGEEVNQYDTDPLNPDSENDGLSDGDEVNIYNADPNNPDTDEDGLTDGQEVNEYGTSPTEPDTDGDGFNDDVEISNGTDPLDANDPAPTATVTPTPTDTPTPTATPTAVPSEPSILVYASNDSLLALSLELVDGELQAAETTELAVGDGFSQIKISPDGEKVAFLQTLIGSNNQLFIVNIDGTGLQHIADSGELSQDPVGGADPQITRRIVGDFQWLSDSERLAYNTYTIGVEAPGLQLNEDLWIVDLNGDLLIEYPPDSVGGTFDISGQDQIVMATTTEVIRMDLDGSNRQTVITFPSAATYSEYAYYPEPKWLPNGDTAYVTISSPDPIFEDQIATYWQIPSSGPAEELNTVDGIFLMDHIYPAPNGNHTAFVRILSDPSNPPHDLIIGDGQAGDVETYGASAFQLEFYEWSADSQHFLYRSQNNGGVFRYHVGRVGQSPLVTVVPGNETVLTPMWATNTTFVLALGSTNDWRIISANLDGAEQLLVNVTVTTPVFDVWTPPPTDFAP